MKESVVETRLRKKCNANGFLCYKFVSPGNSGVPDRIIMGYGLILFVETKAPGKKPRELQVEKIRTMRDHGAIVYVIDTLEKVDKFISCICTAVGVGEQDVKVKKHKVTCECVGYVTKMAKFSKNIDDCQIT